MPLPTVPRRMPASGSSTSSHQANGTAVLTAAAPGSCSRPYNTPHDLGLDLLSLSPTLAQDQVATGRGGWSAERTRTTWRSLDAGATWQAWTPPIAYAAGSEGARTLYIAGAVSPQPAEPRPIPNGGSSENPAWSPGWTHLAFQNNQTGDWEIYRTPADCGGLPAGPSEAAAVKCTATRLTDSAGDDVLPAWSPDGRMIAFVSLRDGNPEIYVMLADGSAANPAHVRSRRRLASRLAARQPPPGLYQRPQRQQ